MVHLKHELVLHDFRNYMKQSGKLAIAARQWIIPSNSLVRPRFTPLHRNILIELAFLRSYLAWERFLEEAFILFLIGKKPRRRRRPPRCFVTPKSRQHAFQLILPETGRSYIDWDNPEIVRIRAKRFFANGEPFESALTSHLYLFQEIQVIRNAIAHRSLTSEEKFHRLVRDKLTYLPANVSVGSFLETTMTGINPPITYLDYYLDGISRTAELIVPL